MILGTSIMRCRVDTDVSKCKSGSRAIDQKENGGCSASFREGIAVSQFRFEKCKDEERSSNRRHMR